MNVILTYKNHSLSFFRTILALLLIAGACSPGVAQAVIVYTGASSGANNALPTNGTAGALIINKPFGTVAGQALIASIAARPSGMTVTVPANWFAMTVTQQLNGGPSTLPGGMTLLTYYHIVGIAEPVSYTWTFANPTLAQGGSAVGGILAFSGIDTSAGSPINVWSALNVNAAPHTTTSITPTLTNTMIVSSISYLSGSSFAPPTSSAGCIVGITEQLDQRAPVAVADIGTTLQMSTATCATATATGSVTAVIQPVGGLGADDSGVGHLMALKPALIDPGITMTRSAPLYPGGSAFYTLTVTNNGINPEPGPISVVDTLPAGLSYASFSGAGWACGAAGQVVTCTRAGALAGGASTVPLVLNVNVSAGASGTITNTATVSGTGGDGNMANNTATDSYTIAVDLALAMTRVGTLNPGQNATYTFDVTNNGTLTEPGPITITDTLPAGLTYVSGVGTGWACSAVGQAVTCTRAGSLAGGAAAATLTLTVAVGLGASGTTITNSAMVAGTGVDSNPANNTASDSYAVPLTTYAYYKMDEASWTGAANEVQDSSGNSLNASRVGGATVTTQVAPLSGLKGDTCMGATIPLGTGAASPNQMGVNTPINPNTLGNAGTVSFWYKNNVAWTSAGATNDRTLLDATGATTNGEFWLVLQQTGILQFSLDNAGGTAQTVTGNVKGFGTNTWHHIAITWDFTAAVHTMSIYVDGGLDNTRNNAAVTSATINYGTFFVGDSKTTVYTNPPNRGNSANGVIDEVRVYATALTAAQITTDMTAAHACSSLNHLEIQHASGTGLTCAASTLTIKACTDAAVPCVTPYVSGVSGTLSATGAVNWDGTTGGAAGAGFVIPNGSSTVTKNVQVTTTPSVVFGITSPIPVPPNGTTCNFGAPVCTFTASTAGFIFSNTATGSSYTIPAQVSGIATPTLYLRAVQALTTNPAVCTPAIISSTTSVNMSYVCNNPAACQAGNLTTITNTITSTATAIAPGGTAVSLNFDANGSAPITARYDDVGQITLNANATIIPFGGATAITLNGSSTFVVAPHHFVVSGVTAGPIKAGNNFSATVTAYNGLGTPAATPNFGKETSPESVTLSSTLVTPNPVTYPAASNPTPGNNVIAGTEFGPGGMVNDANGVAGVNNLSWGEVGNITLTANLTNVSGYLNSGKTATGTSASVGAFIPDHFDTAVVATASVPMPCPTNPTVLICPTLYNGFVYSGQPFSEQVTARNLAGFTTANYHSAYGLSNTVNLTAWDAKGSGITQNPGTGALANITMASTAFSGGVGLTNTQAYTFATSPTNPTDIFLRAVDAVNTTVTSRLAIPANSVEGGVKVVSGKVKISNAHGSEVLPLPLTATVQYWNVTSWVTSTTDSLTQFNTNLSTAGGSIVATIVTGLGGGISVATPGVVTVVGGVKTFTLNKPLLRGSVDISLNAPGYLLAGSNGAGVNPSKAGRATFGVYKGANEFIYLRENY